MEVTKIVDGKRVLCEQSFQEWFQKEKPSFGVVLEKVNGELFNFRHKWSTKGAHVQFDLFGVRFKMTVIRSHREMLDGEVLFDHDFTLHTTVRRKNSDFYIGWKTNGVYEEVILDYFKTYLKIYYRVSDWDL